MKQALLASSIVQGGGNGEAQLSRSAGPQRDGKEDCPGAGKTDGLAIGSIR
jgi:hypothetical protein